MWNAPSKSSRRARRFFPCVFIFALVGPIVLDAEPAVAQRNQVTVSTPFHSVRDSFYETSNVNWRVGGSGAFVQFGNPTTLPPFGNADPNAGIRFGFGNGRSNFNFNFAQGSSRSFTSATPMLTLTDGVPGSLFSGRLTPFVTGVVPISGFGRLPMQPNFMTPSSGTQLIPRSLSQRLHDAKVQQAAEAKSRPRVEETTKKKEATATPVMATAALPPTRAQRTARAQAEQTQAALELGNYIARAEKAARDGKTGAAKIYFRMAAKRATGDQKTELLKRLDEVTRAAKESERSSSSRLRK